jgi:beta-glucosidase
MGVKEILSKMTLQQKLAQISQYNAECLYIGSRGEITGPATELCLSQEDVCSVGSTLNFVGAKEAIAIQRGHLEKDPNQIPLLLMMDVIHGYRTIYPIPLALGASFDTELVESCCEMASEEMSAGGVHVTFAPMVDLVRDPRWGRCMESTGEDTYLNGEMARAMVRGFQKSGKVAACVKHFAAYGQAEGGRDYNTTDISERTLRDV